MFSLKVDEGAVELESDVSEPLKPNTAPRRRLRWWPRRKGRNLPGLDVGSSRLKAVVLSRRDGTIALQQAVLVDTPPSAVKHGALTDSVLVSDELRALFNDHGIKSRHVAVALGGSQIYCQEDQLGEEHDESRPQVETLAERVVPYPMEQAALDYQPLPTDADENPSVLWASAPIERVDWMRQTVTLAGRVPAVMDLEPCALANAWIYNHEPGGNDVSVLLDIGARRLTLALVRGDTLIYSRAADLPGKRTPSEGDDLPERVWAALDRQWEILIERARPLGLGVVYLSGGAARTKQLAETLRQRSGLQVAELDAFRNISYVPDSDAGQAVAEHGPALAVAVGLALRSFDDL